jgi:hypothetical protein
MTDNIKIQDNQVVTTTEETVPLADYIKAQQAELARISQLQADLQERANEIVANLQILLTPKV